MQGISMTTHYIDIRVLPDAEFTQAHLFGALYAKLHRALVQLRANDIGVSFPKYSMQPKTLGDILRLHGKETRLKELLLLDWLKGMRDHVEVSALSPTPKEVQYCSVQRRQFKTNVERLRRRRIARKGETVEEATLAIPASVEKVPNLPYVQLRSQSTNHSFSLYITQNLLQSSPSVGEFNAYGLAKGATIPWF
jgi:CRISPR-associated endonuclease Csy4